MRGDLADPNPAAHRAAQCDGKDRLTFDHASRIAKRDSGRERGIKPYKCRICGCWHVGQAAKVRR